MSVYIEGMGMPEDGRYTLCITHDSSGNVHWVFQNEDTYEFLKHGCVKEIPPHGRLIDTDALVRELNSIRASFGSANGLVEGGLNIAVSTVNGRPTIIPSEGGE